MRYLVLCLFVGCVGSRAPNIDVDVSFSEPAPATTVLEKVVEASGVGGIIDRKAQGAVDYAVDTTVVPAIEGALENIKNRHKPQAAPQIIPVSEPKPNPRVRVLFFSGPGCAPCAVLKNRIKADLVPQGWTFAETSDADIQYCDLDTEEGRAMGAIVGLKEGDALPALFVVEPDGRPLARSVGACTAKELGRWLNEWRERKEQRSVMVQPKAKTPACQCSPCNCVNCACGLQMPAAINGGCSSCGVSYRRGWRR
jgi:hypothetical protein